MCQRVLCIEALTCYNFFVDKKFIFYIFVVLANRVTSHELHSSKEYFQTIAEKQADAELVRSSLIQHI